jgi:photosystem II stability/assembly factor-like uncharacterized protein
LLDYSSGASALLRTSNGGTQWRDVTPLRSTRQRIEVRKVSALSALTAWVVPANTGGPRAEIFRTTDGGRTWKSVAIDSDVLPISFINPHEGWFLNVGSSHPPHGSDQGILHSTDGGGTWTGISGISSSIGSAGDITFLNPTTGWITGVELQYESLPLYVTRDGGRAWPRQNMPVPRELKPHWEGHPQPPKFFTALDGTLLTRYEIYDDAKGWERTGSVIVFYSTHDGGNTWTHTTPLPVSMEKTSYQAVADMNHAWVTHGGVLHATSDGGRHWALLPSNPLFAIPANAAPWTAAPVTQLDFISPEVGWVVRNARVGLDQPTPPFLLKTLDGGRTWSPVTYTISRQ